MVTARADTEAATQQKYLAGLRHINMFAFLVIGVCMASPLLLLVSAPLPLLLAVPFVATSLIGMTMPFTVLRWFGPSIYGGAAASGIIIMLSIVLAMLFVGSAIVLAVNPSGAPYLAVPGIVLVFAMVLMIDLVLRGFLHAWMHHVGFGRLFRLLVPAVLVGLLSVPLAANRDTSLSVALVAASLISGTIRHNLPGLGWLLITPVILLIAMLVATW